MCPHWLQLMPFATIFLFYHGYQYFPGFSEFGEFQTSLHGNLRNTKVVKTNKSVCGVFPSTPHLGFLLRHCDVVNLCRKQRKGDWFKRNNAAVELRDNSSWRQLFVGTSVWSLHDSVSHWHNVVSVWRTIVRSGLWVVDTAGFCSHTWNVRYPLAEFSAPTCMACYRCVLKKTLKILIALCRLTLMMRQLISKDAFPQQEMRSMERVSAQYCCIPCIVIETVDCNCNDLELGLFKVIQDQR